MNTINVTLSLPVRLYNHLISYIPGDKSHHFIVDAIEEKLKQEDKRLKYLMIEGYKTTREEDKKLTIEFEQADFENID
ncbi:MAG: hypothetical protein HY738_23980 [Bacteroidia bacterium]|nr:hypothetical protein [Bacteroidia bacterium]